MESQTKLSRNAIIIISYVVFCIILGCSREISESLFAIAILVCVIFGWQALNKIQPAMFVWMPLGGWLVYFFIKFILSYLVGVFVAPYIIGKNIADKNGVS